MTKRSTRKPRTGRKKGNLRARFVEEYLIDMNASQAALRAGYSPRSAHSQGSRLLKDVEISTQIAAARDQQTERCQVTADKVIAELALLGFANMKDYMKATVGGDPYLDFSQLTREQAAALTEVTVEDFTEGRGDAARDVRRVKFKLADKRAALVDIGKHLGMFVDRIGDPDGKPLAPTAITVRIVKP
jgi:phage terminase small subunit